MPDPELLTAFRDLIIGARCGKVQVSVETSEVIILLDDHDSCIDALNISIFNKTLCASGSRTSLSPRKT